MSCIAWVMSVPFPPGFLPIFFLFLRHLYHQYYTSVRVLALSFVVALRLLDYLKSRLGNGNICDHFNLLNVISARYYMYTLHASPTGR
jgi:hypothetical protein